MTTWPRLLKYDGIKNALKGWMFQELRAAAAAALCSSLLCDNGSTLFRAIGWSHAAECSRCQRSHQPLIFLYNDPYQPSEKMAARHIFNHLTKGEGNFLSESALNASVHRGGPPLPWSLTPTTDSINKRRKRTLFSNVSPKNISPETNYWRVSSPNSPCHVWLHKNTRWPRRSCDEGLEVQATVRWTSPFFCVPIPTPVTMWWP